MSRTPDYEVKIGDTATAFEALLADANGAASIAGSTVTLVMRDRAFRSSRYELAMAIADSATARVRYEWPASPEMPPAGDYDAEIQVDLGDEVAIFPSQGRLLLRLHAAV